MDKWQELVAKAAAVLTKLKINLGDNFLTVNAVLPFWQEFINQHADLKPEDFHVWRLLQTADEQSILIDGLYPQYSIRKFWAESMRLALPNRQNKQN